MSTPYKRRNVDTRSNDHKYEDPILLPNQKIFLSHSGAQTEEFVDQLCVDLERRHRFPFFDKRLSSLPKGERFPPLIKAAAAQCEMMVVVISDKYFTSKWPMIELNAFMKASVKNPKLKILPLFFGLNFKEFSNTPRQERWFKVWETMAEVDDRIKVDEWKESLKLIGCINGLVYDRDSKEVVTYRKMVVSNICKAIPSNLKFDESHVQGRSKLCQVVRQHLEIIPNSTKIPGVRVMGLYGVGGIGKTQICKIVCNALDGEFDGKVCHVELGKQSEHELVKKVLTTLTDTSVEVVQEVGKDKGREVLLNNMIWKQKTFLTIDNVWDDFDSLEQANMFLQAPFVEGSWVILTSRFKKTLKSLGIDQNACFEMPGLDKNDAKNLFLYHATKGKEIEITEDADAIEECIKRCYFYKRESQGSHYHPLSLQNLGVFLQYGGKGPSDWVKDLQKVTESSYLRQPMNPLFTILRINFDRLLSKEQELFMDVSLFFPMKTTYNSWMDLMEWLCLVYNEEKKEIRDWFERLVDSALLEDVDMSSGEVSIHDLYREFAKLESKGKLMPLDMKKRRWVYAEDAFPTELEDEPRTCWKRLTRLCISESQIKKPIRSLRTIKWEYCTKLVVLKLDNVHITGVLNLKGLICLRSLNVCLQYPSSFASIEGLEGLRTLTFFRMVCGHPLSDKGTQDKLPNVGQLPTTLKVWKWVVHITFLLCLSRTYLLTFLKMVCGYTHNYKGTEHKLSIAGQLPAALKVLEVIGTRTTPVLFERGALALCTNLVTLKLSDVLASNLDLKNCTSLQEVELHRVKGLKVLRGFAPELGSSVNIQFL